MKKIMLMLCVVAFLSPLVPRVALACGCAKPANETAEQARAAYLKEVEEATAIFSGEVIESDFFKARFKVEKIWKGEPAEEIVMLTGAKMHSDGSYSRSSCDYGGYHLGKKYLVYAIGPANGLKADACSRTRVVSEAEQDIKELDDLKASGSKHLRRKLQ